MRGIYRGPVNSLHTCPVTRKMFPFDDVIMWCNHSTTTQKEIMHVFMRLTTYYFQITCGVQCTLSDPSWVPWCNFQYHKGTQQLLITGGDKLWIDGLFAKIKFKTNPIKGFFAGINYQYRWKKIFMGRGTYLTINSVMQNAIDSPVASWSFSDPQHGDVTHMR